MSLSAGEEQFGGRVTSGGDHKMALTPGLLDCCPYASSSNPGTSRDVARAKKLQPPNEQTSDRSRGQVNKLGTAYYEEA